MSLLPSATFASGITPAPGVSDYAAKALWATAGTVGPGGGVTQLVAGANITLDPPTGDGVVTITASGGGAGGVTSVTSGGPGITCTPTTGAVVVDNTGVTQLVAGTAMSISGATGAVTVNNAGVTSLVAGANITLSGATGAVTIGAIPTPIFARQPVDQVFLSSTPGSFTLPGNDLASVWTRLTCLSDTPGTNIQSWSFVIPGNTFNINDTWAIALLDPLYDSPGGFYITSVYSVSQNFVAPYQVTVRQVTASTPTGNASCILNLIRLKGQ